jgi:hypothetical protein
MMPKENDRKQFSAKNSSSLEPSLLLLLLLLLCWNEFSSWNSIKFFNDYVTSIRQKIHPNQQWYRLLQPADRKMIFIILLRLRPMTKLSANRWSLLEAGDVHSVFSPNGKK